MNELAQFNKEMLLLQEGGVAALNKNPQDSTTVGKLVSVAYLSGASLLPANKWAELFSELAVIAAELADMFFKNGKIRVRLSIGNIWRLGKLIFKSYLRLRQIFKKG